MYATNINDFKTSIRNSISKFDGVTIVSYTILEIDGKKVDDPIEEFVPGVPGKEKPLLKDAKLGDVYKNRNGDKYVLVEFTDHNIYKYKWADKLLGEKYSTYTTDINGKYDATDLGVRGLNIVEPLNQQINIPAEPISPKEAKEYAMPETTHTITFVPECGFTKTITCSSSLLCEILTYIGDKYGYHTISSVKKNI